MENLKALTEMEDLAENGRSLLKFILQIDGVDHSPWYGILASYFQFRDEITGATKSG